ncbi:origin recognition complex subunit 4 C-terminus-domain-containing protein [Lenzites betulinus]|nr:origin recognition complex subunit 4 C-terminus-domain-containing protein [Lenzites betulinus]
MAPKRKAAAATTENEPPQIRRRTRATVGAGDLVEPTAEEPPAAKKAKRSTKAQKAPAQPIKDAEALVSAPSVTNTAPRAARATARTRKTASKPEVTEETEAGPSVPKRNTRSNKAQSVEEEASTHIQAIPQKRGRSKKLQESAVAPPVEPDTLAEASGRPRTRGNVLVHDVGADTKPQAAQAALPNSVSATSPRKGTGKPTKVPTLAPLPRPATPPAPDEESSDDELLMTPSRRKNARLTTPIQTGGSRVGTPRMVLHSVEISTPRRLLNTVRRDLGSPGPRVHVPPLGTPRLPSAFPSASPQKRAIPAPPLSPSRLKTARVPFPEASELEVSVQTKSPAKQPREQREHLIKELPQVLPSRLHPLLERQKRTILQALQHPPEIDEIEVYGEDYPPTNTLAYEQLSDLLTGTVTRGEGNSCLLIGPSGSGKTQMVERAIAALPDNPIVVRLSGHAQHNDRLAIREIAWQLAQQTGHSFLPANDDDSEDEDVDPASGAPVPPPEGDENPFVDGTPAANPGTGLAVTLPPPAHLLAVISMIPTLPRPTIIVLDGFDLFAAHARQALLYCLLDTAQACRAGPATAAGVRSASGMAVVGVTPRVDTINLLEKRVKSRFSGRMIRTAGPARVGHWVALVKAAVGASVFAGDEDGDEEREWREMWDVAVERLLKDDAALDALGETYALARDYQLLRRILTCLVLELTPSSPYPTAAKLERAIVRQRCPPRFPALHNLPYPAVCLLISSVHAQTSGHDVFTFEMLHETFKNQVRTSQSAPVQVEGGGIGMVRCSREVLYAAFERLADLRIFLPAAAPGATVGPEFALYRSVVDRFTVKKAVETIGQLSLKKWFTKAQ